MPRKKHSAEEIIRKLREAEVLQNVPEVSRILGEAFCRERVSAAVSGSSVRVERIS